MFDDASQKTCSDVTPSVHMYRSNSFAQHCKSSKKCGFWQGLFALLCKSEGHRKAAVVILKDYHSFLLSFVIYSVKISFFKGER